MGHVDRNFFGVKIRVAISKCQHVGTPISGAYAPLLPAVRVQPDAGLRPHQVQEDDALLRALGRIV